MRRQAEHDRYRARPRIGQAGLRRCSVPVRDRPSPRLAVAFLVVVDRTALPWGGGRYRHRRPAAGGYQTDETGPPTRVWPLSQGRCPSTAPAWSPVRPPRRWLVLARRRVPPRRSSAVPAQPQADQLADDLCLQVHRQGPAVACPQVLQLLTPALAQRLVAEHPLGKEQPLDPVDVPHPFADQDPVLAADTADPPRGVGALAIRTTRGSPRLKAIRVRTKVSPSTRSVFACRRWREARSRRRRPLALDPFGPQHPVDPEAIEIRSLVPVSPA